MASWLKEHWGSESIVVHGKRHRAQDLFALKACYSPSDQHCLSRSLPTKKPRHYVGMITYVDRGLTWEIITLDADPPGRGIGTALVQAMTARALAVGVIGLSVTTTNDNLSALGFWQSQGFRMVRVRPDAVAVARCLKPEIPRVAENGIPIRDEVDLILGLG
ncbi:hypothetical protein KEM60_00531 [Austwickia sp. TVS 96-490-7B]|nr:hypothetical protein [Austwickia sp. TVS 96-490-7B]